MAKGFGMAAERIRGNDMSLATAFDTLGTVLMTEIGGSMGPSSTSTTCFRQKFSPLPRRPFSMLSAPPQGRFMRQRSEERHKPSNKMNAFQLPTRRQSSRQ